MRITRWWSVLVGAVTLMAVGGTGVAAQSPSPVPSAPAGVLQVTLAATSVLGDSDYQLVRTTLQPGARLEGISQPGTALSSVESGSLWVTASDPDLASMVGLNEPVGLGPDTPRAVLAGQAFVSRPGSVMTWQNPGTEPAVILTARLLDPPWAASPDQGAEAATFAAPVRHRFVVIGPKLGGTHGRFTVKDRSGRVIGARLPTDRELRFWSPVGDGVGPVSEVHPGLTEMMVSWEGGVCGPIVTLDVAKDLHAIRMTDGSPGCDAAARGHWLVLQLRGGWFDASRIRQEWPDPER